MTRPPKRLQDSIEVVRVTPRLATTMLIHGLLPEGTENFQPAKLTVDALIKMLKQANEVRNRVVTLDVVRKYSRDMSDGNWLWTGAPIQIDHDGFVRNGQHRLLAVVHSNTTHDMLVVRNVDPRSQLVMDIGRPRSVANQMQMAGIGSASRATTIANTLLRWRGGLMLNSFSPSVLEVNQIIESESEIPNAINLAHRVFRNVGRAPQGALGAAFVEAGHVDVEARDQFFDQLVTGADLVAGNPILVLRNQMARQLTHQVRFRRAGQLYQIVQAWNLWRKGDNAKILRPPNKLTSDTFPNMR
jgi:hypothetical protein